MNNMDDKTDDKIPGNNIETVTSRYVNLYPRIVCTILDILKNDRYTTIESILPCLKDSIIFLESIQRMGYLTIEDVASFIHNVELRAKGIDCDVIDQIES